MFLKGAIDRDASEGIIDSRNNSKKTASNRKQTYFSHPRSQLANPILLRSSIDDALEDKSSVDIPRDGIVQDLFMAALFFTEKSVKNFTRNIVVPAPRSTYIFESRARSQEFFPFHVRRKKLFTAVGFERYVN